MVCTRRIGLVEVRGAVIVEAANQTRDAERSTAVALRVLLFERGHVTRDVLECDRVLHGQTVRLALESGATDEDTRVRRQTWRGQSEVRSEVRSHTVETLGGISIM